MTAVQPRTVPYSVEAEQAVLGALMLDNLTTYPVMALIGADDFFRQDHQVLFRTITALVKAGKGADLVTVTEALRLAGTLQDVGGMAYLGSLLSDSWNTSNAEAHAKLIRDYSQRRRLIAFSGDVGEKAWTSDAEEATAFMMGKVQGLLTKATAKSKRFQEAIADAQDVMAEARKNAAHGGPVGAPTGLHSLDRLLGGFSGPRLYILAARPKCGKSALLNQFGVNAAMNGWPGLIVSRELGSDELAIRAMAMLAGVNVTRLHRGQKQEADDAGSRATSIGDIPLWFDDETATIDAICAQIAMHKFRHGIQWAAVDHIGLVRTEQRFNSRNDQLGHISWTLKETAKRLKIPIIALSQLNRSSEKDGRRPGVHDLRDSGNIEQDADAVIMMHVEPERRDEAIKPVSIGVPANRIGPSMWLDTPFEFHGAIQTFYDRSQRAEG